jgi:hypothetical protein
MVAVTYGTRPVSAAPVTDATPAKKGFFARLLDAMEASQLKRAERDLARYRHLLPEDHELRSGQLVAKEPAQRGW